MLLISFSRWEIATQPNVIQFAKYIAKLVTFLFVYAMNAIWPPMYSFSKRDQFSRHCK